MSWQIILITLIVLSGYPIGLLIARACQEELKQGRKWFKLIMSACIVLIIISLIFMHSAELFFLICVFIFIFLLVLAGLIKSKNIKR